MNEIGLRLTELRKSVSLSQAKIGALAGLPQSSIDRYEKGKTLLPPNVLLWYAEHFDVSLDYIFCRTDNPKGSLYEYNPRIENSDMKQFIEMCFDPNSSMNSKLKETLVKLLHEEESP